MLSFLAPRATPGIEIVEAGIYRRSISLGGAHGWFEVSLDEPNHSLALRVHFRDPRCLFLICERVRAMFDLNADWIAIVSALRCSPLLSTHLDAAPGLRMPGCWDGFELSIRAIIGQQISVKGATTLTGRLVREFGKYSALRLAAKRTDPRFPTPDVLADADLTRAGLTNARAATIRVLARAVCEQQISFVGVIDSVAFQTSLCEIPGIGKWTAQYVAMRALGDPDAFPSSDLGLLRASGLTTFAILRARPKPGGHGELTQPCTSGASPAKIETQASHRWPGAGRAGEQHHRSPADHCRCLTSCRGTSGSSPVWTSGKYYLLLLLDPPSNDPSTPRTISRPTLLPMVRAALLAIAAPKESPRRPPVEPPPRPKRVERWQIGVPRLVLPLRRGSRTSRRCRLSCAPLQHFERRLAIYRIFVHARHERRLSLELRAAPE